MTSLPKGKVRMKTGSAFLAGRRWEYEYDAIGNRLTASVPSGIVPAPAPGCNILWWSVPMATQGRCHGLNLVTLRATTPVVQTSAHGNAVPLTLSLAARMSAAMITVPVSLADKSYDVLIGDGLLETAGREAAKLFPDAAACAVVSDDNVAPLYAGKVCGSLRAAGIVPHLITVPSGEPSKSFSALESVTRAMISAGLDRKAFLVALGGGVIGDLAGFAASIFLRGIPYIQIPTTVVSVVDSSVGGKTGINTPEGKNLVGTFHQPRKVLIDPVTLNSLPPREYREGFAEIIKHAAIRDAAMLPEIARIAASGSREGLAPLIAANAGIKASIVSEDEFETKGLRALLNFGHTIGHAIEASAGYGQLLHGEAISLGIRAALRLSEQCAGLPAGDSREILSLLAAFHLPLVLPESIATEGIMEKMSRDKKFDRGSIRFVLLRRCGDAFVSDAVTRDAIAAAVEGLRSPDVF